MYEVLIVEDDPMVAMINKQYVSENPHFHVCAVCRDGVSGLEYLKTHTVHLVILDQYMPQTDGLTLLRQIRENGLPVSVIMVTAANDSSMVETALRLGVVDYLVKPFCSERFNQALNTFLRRSAAFEELNAFSQQNIDALMGSGSDINNAELPKGIQDTTLKTLRDFLKSNSNTEFAGEEIADKVGLSRVTIRRYMNYLLEMGHITGRMNYETGGRPSMLYRWSDI